MEDDLRPGVNVEENPLAKALEVQQKRVLDAVELAILQAINDIRGTFDDLSEVDEAFFEARLHEAVFDDALFRNTHLLKKMADAGDPRVEVLSKAISDAIGRAADKNFPKDDENG